ncbi:MAG: hypothetical protein IIZ18_08185 [Ruminococcus sp.]|nr:hypothetical protein [Ruminococcus sp.]
MRGNIRIMHPHAKYGYRCQLSGGCITGGASRWKPDTHQVSTTQSALRLGGTVAPLALCGADLTT